MKIILANPRGFCAGVERAIAIVESVLEKFGAPIYVRHEVVHNKFVCDNLRDKGAIFVDELDDVPDGSTVIFSAHGVPRAIRDEATRRGLRVFDAACPLVTKVHNRVARIREEGYEIIMVGHKGHPEVEGTMGQSPDGMYLVETVDDIQNIHINGDKPLAYVTQTTLSIDDVECIVHALKERFPEIIGPKSDDICYATQNRQNAVKNLADQTDIVFVVGSQSSSNSNRLREVAELRGTKAYLVDYAEQIDLADLKTTDRIGITAGASAPEILVQHVIDKLTGAFHAQILQLQGAEEHVTFALPKELQDTSEC